MNNACLHTQCHVVSAGEMRNDLYVTLEKGEFEKGGKSVARNVEVTVYVLDVDGQVVKVRLPMSALHGPPFLGLTSLSRSLSLNLSLPLNLSPSLLPPELRGRRLRGTGLRPVPLTGAVPQQQPPLGRADQAAHPGGHVPRLARALRVPTLFQ